MGDFRSNSRGGNRFGGNRSGGNRFGGSRGGFGGERRGGFGGRGRDGPRRPLEMHDAICDKCKKECQVPFRPSKDKPVLCSDCFKNSGNGNGGRSERGNAPQGGISNEQFNQINKKLDKILAFMEELEVAEDEDMSDDLEEIEEDEEEQPSLLNSEEEEAEEEESEEDSEQK